MTAPYQPGTYRLGQFEHMKFAAFDNIKEIEGEPVFFIEGLRTAIPMIALLSGYCDTGAHECTFPLNAEGIPWIEEFLKEYVTSWVTKWDKLSNPLSAKAPKDYEEQTIAQGLRDGSVPDAEALELVRSRLIAAGVVYGQCLAGEFDMKWALNKMDPGSPWLHLDVPGEEPSTLQTWWKVSKFAHLGDEDSLVCWVNILRNRDFNNEVMKTLSQFLKDNKRKFSMRKLHGYQVWHSPDGFIEGVVLLDKNKRPVKKIGVASLMSMPTVGGVQ